MPRNLTVMLSAFRLNFPTNVSANFMESHLSRAQKSKDFYQKYPLRKFNFQGVNRFADILKATQSISASRLIELAKVASSQKPPSVPTLISSVIDRNLSQPAKAATVKKPSTIPSSITSSEQYAKFVLAAKSKKPPLPPTESPTNNQIRENKSIKSILKSTGVSSPIHVIPALSPSQIFQGILDLNLLGEKEERERVNGKYSLETDEEYSDRIYELCKKLTQKERNELFEYVSAVRETSTYTRKLNPSESPGNVLDRLKIPNENRKKTNAHYERLADHYHSKLKLAKNAIFFKTTHNEGEMEIQSSEFPLQTNLKDRSVSNIEKITYENHEGLARTKKIGRTFYPRDVDDNLSVRSQLSKRSR